MEVCGIERVYFLPAGIESINLTQSFVSSKVIRPRLYRQLRGLLNTAFFGNIILELYS